MQIIHHQGSGNRFFQTYRTTIRGCVFVHSAHKIVSRLGACGLPVLHCIVRPRGNRGRVVIIPRRRVQGFVTITNGRSRRILFVSPRRITLSGKSGIQVANNMFRKIRNRLVQIGGSHKGQIIIGVSNVATITATSVPSTLIRGV